MKRRKTIHTFVFKVDYIHKSMQTTKESTRKLLQKTARDAFLRKGFKAVSMREISKQSGVCLSNIYNYYPCKDDLLHIVLHPLLDAMEALLDNHNNGEYLSLEVFTSEEYCHKYMQEIVSIITRYREDLRLLFLGVQGSKLEDYCVQWIERSTKIGVEYMELMNNKFPDLRTNISPFFIHFTSSWWLNMIKEVTLHKELSPEEMERFIREFVLYSTGGWSKLMKVERLPGQPTENPPTKIGDNKANTIKHETNDRSPSQEAF